MKIRAQIISLLALLFAVLIVLGIAIQEHVLMPSFAELERDDAKTSMTRIDYALNVALDNLQLRAADWGDWEALYQYVPAPTAEFVDRYITAVSLKQLQINTVMIVDLKGNVLAAGALDLDSGAPLNLDFAAMRMLPEDLPWRRNLAIRVGAKGLVRTNQGVMMVASGPILDGSTGGRSLGMVIMGKLLSPRQVQMIGAQAQADLSMMSDGFAGGADRLVETDAVTQVYRPYSDIYGKPLMSFKVEVPRKITERGRGAVTYASACLIAAGLAALILLVTLLNRIVIAPLARVTRHAVTIGEGTDLTTRLDLPGRDEVAVLAREFDRMVERVAESRRLLMDQSFQAGFAELAKGVLHNLGNAMTPLGVRLSKLGERLRDAPAADVELAAIELAREVHGTERYADLQELLRLGCREMATALMDAREDVTVIQRQTVVVQTALADLMRSTRNEHVVESVRLPDLVSQTLEIVPDASRRRLVIETDESLRHVGVVRVARTVLRLVLQNLIINAADAVRDAGRDKGVFRMAAEIVRGSDREQLHLRCEDDGVGIAKADLERVFEHGFTTKPRATNHGIGLHWCANAMGALGGRIWAVSDGPGHGASMHLMLPLPLPVRVSQTNS
jgi:two-component system, NtrC family, sensor kinase